MKEDLVKRLLVGALTIGLAGAGAVKGYHYKQEKDYERLQGLVKEYVKGANGDEVWAKVVAEQDKRQAERQELIKKGLLEDSPEVMFFEPADAGKRFRDTVVGGLLSETLIDPLSPLVKAPFKLPYDVSSGEFYKHLEEKEKKKIRKEYGEKSGRFPYREIVARIRLHNFIKKKGFGIEDSVFENEHSLRQCLGYEKSSELCDAYGCESPKIKDLAERLYSERRCFGEN